MMTCDDLRQALDAYRAGTLDEARSVALEEHAASCADCESLLEEATAGLLPAFAPALPATLRATVLHAVAARRRARRTIEWRPVSALVVAAALVAIIVRPTTQVTPPSLSDTAVVASSVVPARMADADEIARSEFRALDDAARELQAALARTPDDAELAAFLRRVNDQRAALRRQVQDARS